MAGDTFFAKTRKRKRPTTNGTVTGKTKKGLISKEFSSKRRRRDDELDSDGSDDDVGGNIDDLDLRESDEDEHASGDELENETPAQKRLRLAKLYLQSVKEDLGDGEVDAAEIDRELIASRLKQDVLQHSGKISLFVAEQIPLDEPLRSLCTRGHRFSITSAVASEDARYLYTSGKEASIIKWDLRTGKKLKTFAKVRNPSQSSKGKGKAKAQTSLEGIEGHSDEVLSLALSGDGKFLASGGRDRRLGVWDVGGDKWLRGFSGHRDIISGVVFRKGTQQLYTGSFDRTVKVFDLGIMGYVETLFGHQDSITSIDSLRGEFAVTAGGQDRTVRYWKIVEESQLVFRGGGRSKIRDMLEGGVEDVADEDQPESSKRENQNQKRDEGFIEGRIDCVAMLDESTFVSGGDSGSVSLWSTTKKKPLYSQAQAHGIEEHSSESGGNVRNPRWITSIAALPYSDVFATGSWDGFIRLWKLDSSLRSFSPLRTINAPGFVNSLQLIRPPYGSLDGAIWLEDGPSKTLNSDTPSGETKSSAPKTTSSRRQDILLISGMGQEPRLGRWKQLKGENIRNATIVHALTRPADST